MSDDGDEQVVDAVVEQSGHLQQLAASFRAQPLTLCTHAATATSSVHGDLGKSRIAGAARSHLCTHPIRCDWLGRNGLIITRAVRHFAITTFGYGRWKRLPSWLTGK